MANIPFQPSQATLPTRTYGGKVSAYETGGIQLGQGLSVMARVQEQFNQADVQNQVSNANSFLAQKIGDFEDKWQNVVKVYNENSMTELDNDIQSIYENLGKQGYGREALAKIKPGLDEATSRLKVAGHGIVLKLQAQKFVADSNTNIQQYIEQSVNNPNKRTELRGLMKAQITGDINNGVRTFDEGRQVLEGVDESIMLFDMQKLANENPQEFLKRAERGDFNKNYQHLPALTEHANNSIIQGIAKEEALRKKNQEKTMEMVVGQVTQATLKGQILDINAIIKDLINKDGSLKIPLDDFLKLNYNLTNILMSPTTTPTPRGIIKHQEIGKMADNGDINGAYRQLALYSSVLTTEQFSDLDKRLKVVIDPILKDQKARAQAFLDQPVWSFLGVADKAAILSKADIDLRSANINPDGYFRRVADTTNTLFNYLIKTKQIAISPQQMKLFAQGGEDAQKNLTPTWTDVHTGMHSSVGGAIGTQHIPWAATTLPPTEQEKQNKAVRQLQAIQNNKTISAQAYAEIYYRNQGDAVKMFSEIEQMGTGKETKEKTESPSQVVKGVVPPPRIVAPQEKQKEEKPEALKNITVEEFVENAGDFWSDFEFEDVKRYFMKHYNEIAKVYKENLKRGTEEAENQLLGDIFLNYPNYKPEDLEKIFIEQYNKFKKLRIPGTQGMGTR